MMITEQPGIKIGDLVYYDQMTVCDVGLVISIYETTALIIGIYGKKLNNKIILKKPVTELYKSSKIASLDGNINEIYQVKYHEKNRLINPSYDMCNYVIILDDTNGLSSYILSIMWREYESKFYLTHKVINESSDQMKNIRKMEKYRDILTISN